MLGGRGRTMVGTNEIKRFAVRSSETHDLAMTTPAGLRTRRSAGVFATCDRAEGVGFEPTMSFPIPVFKTGAIGH